MSELAPKLPASFIDHLLADMQRLGNRPYAEIGVPMFIVAEDLTSAAQDRAVADPRGGTQLATLFAEAATALKAHQAELTAGDIARLVEVIADRHFLAFATPAFGQTAASQAEAD